MHRFLLSSALLLSFVAPVAAQEPAKVTTLFSRDLSDVPGKEGLMLIVEYPPGAADPVHRHNANAFVYVLEGSIIMQVKGSEPVTLHPVCLYLRARFVASRQGLSAHGGRPCRPRYWARQDRIMARR